MAKTAEDSRLLTNSTVFRVLELLAGLGTPAKGNTGQGPTTPILPYTRTTLTHPLPTHTTPCLAPTWHPPGTRRTRTGVPDVHSGGATARGAGSGETQ